jgi:hypothetical protein
MALCYCFLFCSVMCEPESCYGGSWYTTDTVKILPLQNTYNAGDQITIKAILNATGEYHESAQVNVFEETQDNFAEIIFSGFEMFSEGNQIEILHGQPGSNGFTFLMPYNPDNAAYELELKVTLNRPGLYSSDVANYVSIWIKGHSCETYDVSTDFEGWESPAAMEFTVN